MSVEISKELPGVDAADAELQRLMDEDAQEQAQQPEDQASEETPGESVDAIEGEEHAAPIPKGKKIESTPGSANRPKPKAETQATADPKDKDKSKNPPTAEEKAAAAAKKEPTRYEKAAARQKNSWEEINAQKAQLKAERDAITRERQELEARRTEAEKEYSPEEYEKAAKAFEAEGKFDLAELAANKAEALRKNPPQARDLQAKAQRQQQQQATEAQRKEYALKAAVDYPELAKQNSPLQVRVAKLLQDEPDLRAHPKGIYMAARIAHLETEAARVSAQDEELTQLRAKVKEFEELTSSPTGGGTTQLQKERSFDQKNDPEQYAELAAMAREVGSIR